MHDLEKTGELPNQQSIYPKLDADPGIGTIRYVVIHKALMPESKVSGRGALSLQIKYAIRRVAGSPVKWFGPGAVQPAGRGAAAVRVHAPPAAPDPRGQPGAQARGLSRQAEQPVRAGWPNGMSGGREPSSYGSRPLHMRMMQSGRYCL